MAEWLDKILAIEEIYNPIINKSHCDIIQGKRKKNQYGQQYKIFYKKTVKHFSLSNPADQDIIITPFLIHQTIIGGNYQTVQWNQP